MHVFDVVNAGHSSTLGDFGLVLYSDPITKLNVEDLSFERVLGFLRYLENDRHNHARTRNQPLAALLTLFDYIAGREPEMLWTCQRVRAIPMKRAPPAETHFLERDEVGALLRHLPRTGRFALRDQTLLLFLYHTGARAQEVADLRAGNLELGENAVVHLHGKGGRWRTARYGTRPQRSWPNYTRIPRTTGSRRASCDA